MLTSTCSRDPAECGAGLSMKGAITRFRNSPHHDARDPRKCGDLLISSEERREVQELRAAMEALTTLSTNLTRTTEVSKTCLHPIIDSLQITAEDDESYGYTDFDLPKCSS